MSPMKRVQITLDPDTLSVLDAIETLTGASRGEIIRRGFAAYTGRAGTLPSPSDVLAVMEKIKGKKSKK